MDLTGLKWSKNVNHLGDIKYWTYDIDSTSRVFILGWKDKYKDNACNPKEGEFIILRQHAKVTHIVKVFNDHLYDDGLKSGFSICRLVQVVWMSKKFDDISLPTNKEVFGYDITFPPDGKIYNLETKDDFKEHWDKNGGLLGFQNHVQFVLNERGYWQQPLVELHKCLVN